MFESQNKRSRRSGDIGKAAALLTRKQLYERYVAHMMLTKPKKPTAEYKRTAPAIDAEGFQTLQQLQLALAKVTADHADAEALATLGRAVVARENRETEENSAALRSANKARK